MAEPMVELVQQDVQVYSAPDDVFASFDDDSGARVREWRADCRDVDTDPLKYDVKLRDERRDDTPDRLKEQLKEVKVGNLSSLPILLFVCFSDRAYVVYSFLSLSNVWSPFAA